MFLLGMLAAWLVAECKPNADEIGIKSEHGRLVVQHRGFQFDTADLRYEATSVGAPRVPSSFTFKSEGARVAVEIDKKMRIEADEVRYSKPSGILSCSSTGATKVRLLFKQGDKWAVNTEAKKSIQYFVGGSFGFDD